MPKSFRILLAWLVTVSVVTVGGVLPHHHDANGGVCFGVEHRHADAPHGEEGCPLESGLVASLHSSNEDDACGLCDHRHDNDHHDMSLVAVLPYVIEPPEPIVRRPYYERSVPDLLPAWALGAPLRAPPVC